MAEKIQFFDVSVNRKLESKIPSNTELTIQELAEEARNLNSLIFDSENFVRDMANFNIDPLARSKTHKWEMAVGTIMYAISGQIPDRMDILRGRQIIERLPKTLKSDLDLHFSLSYLPYVLVGFNLDHRDKHVEEANKITNAVSFISHTYNNDVVNCWSFLCAHREATIKRPMTLVDEIVEDRVIRAINLELGILSNANLDSASITWKQQQATEKAASNMFPDIFINYMNKGKISDLLLLLDSHFCGVESILQSKSTEKLKLSLGGQDSYTSLLENELEIRYGKSWKDLKNSKDYIGEDVFGILEIADQLTSKEIARLKVHFEVSDETAWKAEIKELIRKNLERAQHLESVGKKLSSNISLTETTTSAIEWFMRNQDMTFFAKSIYETMFYFYWGQISVKNNQVGIGIDRDYGSFQIRSWEAGYGKKNTGPILYARRTESEKAGGRLREISYRQFWRKKLFF